MPVLSELPLKLNFEEAVEYHGLRCRGLVRPRTVDALKALIDDIQQNGHFKPEISYEIIPIKEVSKGFIQLSSQQKIAAPIAAPIASHHLKNASHLLVGVCTLGEQISKTISQLFHNSKRFNALLMEELTNHALFKLSSQIEKLADKEAAAMGLTASGPINPGDDGFELSSQQQILEFAGASAINVNISSTQMMLPQHSISVVHGLGKKMKKWTQSKNCESCSSKDRCRHRIAIIAMEEKKSVSTVCFKPENKSIKSNQGETLLDAAQKADVSIASTCGGRGICKSCVIQYKSDNAPEPSEQDQLFFSKSKLQKGWRRACQSTANSDCTIHVPKKTGAKASRLNVSSNDIWVHPELLLKKFTLNLSKPDLQHNQSDAERLIDGINLLESESCNKIDFHLLQGMPTFLREQNWSVQAVIREKEIIAIQEVDSPLLGLAIDLGTTNIALLLIDLTTGNTLSSMGVENPQKVFGADVIARISKAKGKPEILQQMQQLLVKTINESAAKLCLENKVDKSSIMELVVAGNTAMHHLFLGLSVDSLGVAPFTAVRSEEHTSELQSR